MATTPVPKAPQSGSQSGFTLIEVMVAAVIAVIAVTALAHSFGIGRGLIDRYETARDALALVQKRLERLASVDPSHAELLPGPHSAGVIAISDKVSGQETWTVDWVDDPVDGTGLGDLTGPEDYKRATVMIAWSEAGDTESIQLSRIILVRSP